MKLKQYQLDTLRILRSYFEAARLSGAKTAYKDVTSQIEIKRRLGPFLGPYNKLNALPHVPYVCLRLPTGGGKTILASYAISIAKDAWIERNYPIVLWLVPSNTIRVQTVEALTNIHHPYRQTLEKDFDGNVKIIDISDFTHLRPQDIHNNLCVIVGTIQSLRISNTEGRKVYAHNEDMEPHFSTTPANAAGYEKTPEGSIKYSFANLLFRYKPLMIVDEAHNAVTGLTREMQRRVNPSAIIEFTATPRPNSNILYSVSAQELKLEEMVKLPIILSEHDNWQNAVNGAIAARASLAEAAQKDQDYLRPLVLFQAQPKDQEVTVAVLKQHLMDVEQIPEHKIAIATGDQRELDGIDLFDPGCKIEFIITVQALKEGWDCSFAYIFSSVSRIHSAVDVEQLLGRVLRMPYAQRRKNEELNRAYAFLSEPSFGEAAKSLTDKLIAMGFDEEEARDNIEQAELDLDTNPDLFNQRTKKKPTFRHTLKPNPKLKKALQESADKNVRHVEKEDGNIEVIISGYVRKEIENVIAEAVGQNEYKKFTAAVNSYRETEAQSLSPAEKGERFTVPRMVTYLQGELEFADTEVFMEYHDWSIHDYSPKFTAEEFSIHETARSFEIDIDGNHVTYQFASEEEQLALDIDVEGWTPESLTIWLDKQTRQPDVSQADLLKWIGDLVSDLLLERKIHITALMRAKFLLARKIRDKIKAIRQKERDSVYQKALFDPGAKVEISFESPFEFKEGMYFDQKRFHGHWKPRSHFLGPDFVPAFDGGTDGEEVQCAMAIDSISEIKYWLRNVSRHPASFWLPTATDKFYPDFVAELNDGRFFVIEYKGELTAETADTREKRTIGQLYEEKSDGKCLFLIVEKDKDGKNMRDQILAKMNA